MKLPEIIISVKYKGVLKTELKTLQSSRDTFEVLQMMYDDNTFQWAEQMVMICLNRANKVIGYYKLSSGGTTGTVCDPKIVFTTALNCAGTTSIIISHNHPSGNLTPSNADDVVTEKLKKAGDFLDIKILDHIIVTDDGYYSYADEGRIIEK